MIANLSWSTTKIKPCAFLWRSDMTKQWKQNNIKNEEKNIFLIISKTFMMKLIGFESR